MGVFVQGGKKLEELLTFLWVLIRFFVTIFKTQSFWKSQSLEMTAHL